MVKYFLLIIFINITYLNVAAQHRSVRLSGKYQNDVESSNLKGKVKSIISYEYRENKTNGDLDTQWSSKSICIFNKAGNIEEISIYNRQNLITLHFLNSYDKKGRKTSTTDKKEDFKNFSEYNHDNERNLVESVYSGNRLSFRFIYNKFGKRDTMYSYDAEEKLMSKVVYNYDKHGNCIQEIWYKSDTTLNKTQVYIYDQQGKKIQEDNYDANGIKTSKIAYTYDKLYNIVLTLDSNMMFIGGIPRKKLGIDTYSRTFKYDAFDKYENWLTRSIIIDNKPIQMTKREITYY